MKRIKIFFPYCGETMGGSHISSLILINLLRKKNFDILIGIHSEGIFKTYCKKKKIPFFFLNKKYFSNSSNFLTNIFNLIFNLWFSYKFLKKNQVDIIHINDYRMLNTWAIISYISKIKKIIFHQRNPLPNSRWVKFNLKIVSKIISISKFVFSTLEKKIKKKSVIIHNPIKEIKIKNKSKKNIIGFVGTYVKRKRPEIFFKFAEKLTLQKEIFKFIFIGNISDKNIRQVYKQYPVLKKKLMFTKFRMNPYPLIQQCRLIICPAKNEGFGRVPLEAGYLKVPSLVSYSGGHKEFIQSKLCLFAKGNNEVSYLKVYKKALNNKIRKNLINNILKFNKKYTLPSLHTKNIINVYFE